MIPIKKILIGLGITFAILLSFSGWYTMKFSMREVISSEVRPDNFTSTVLIATQGSKYKDALVEGVVDYLKVRPVYVKIFDVSKLPSVDHDAWDAILIFHTWEMTEPPEPVSKFVEKNYNSTKMLVVSTSESGEEKIDGIDALTGASRMEELSTHLSTVVSFLNDTLELDQPISN